MHRAEKGPSECGWKRGTGRQQQKNAGEGKKLPKTGQLHGDDFVDEQPSRIFLWEVPADPQLGILCNNFGNP